MRYAVLILLLLAGCFKAAEPEVRIVKVPVCKCAGCDCDPCECKMCKCGAKAEAPKVEELPAPKPAPCKNAACKCDPCHCGNCGCGRSVEPCPSPARKPPFSFEKSGMSPELAAKLGRYILPRTCPKCGGPTKTEGNEWWCEKCHPPEPAPKPKVIWEKTIYATGRTPTCPFCGQWDQVTPGTPQSDGTLDDNRSCFRCNKKFTKPNDPIDGEPKPMVIRLESTPVAEPPLEVDPLPFMYPEPEETCFKNKPVRGWFKKHFGRCG